MRRLALVCLLGGVAAGCDQPGGVQVAIATAKAAPDVAAADEKDCDCKGGSCDEAAAAVEDTEIVRVGVDGAPTAIFDGQRLRGATVTESDDALVTVVAFSDYQCPYCAIGDTTVRALAAEYGSKLRFVMRQLPLPMHKNAERAAIAAIAAGEQGKYWEMHEKLFSNQRALDDASLEKYALEIGLDVARFKQSVSNPATKDQVRADALAAAALGVRGTPAYFINGRRIVGARPLADFKQLIGRELQRAEKLLQSGVQRSQLYAALTEPAKQ